MPILDLQRSVRQVGRIRLGELAATRSGKAAPTKLGTFRLSSPQRQPIELAAHLYGGAVTEMRSDRSDDRWQVTTTSDSIPVIIPPTSHLSQHYELWDAAGCQRRCDGQEATVMDGRPVRSATCACDPDRRDCTITTRLSVVLPELEALGVWRLDTKGWYAATELAGAADLCAAATGRGVPIPARLDLEQRTRRSRGQDGRPQTFKFAVPVLSVDVSLPQAQAILGRVDTGTGEIARPPAPALTAGDTNHTSVNTSNTRPPPPAELPPPPPADIPAPRTAAQYQAAQDEPTEAPELPLTEPSTGGMGEAQKWAAALRGNLSDDDRHTLEGLTIGRPAARYDDLNVKQRNQVAKWASQIEAGALTLQRYPSGPALIDSDDNVVASAEEAPA
jgi:hypothetical protein